MVNRRTNSNVHKIPVSLKKYNSDYSTKLFWRYRDEAVNCLLCIFSPHFPKKKDAVLSRKEKNRPLADSDSHVCIKTNSLNASCRSKSCVCQPSAERLDISVHTCRRTMSPASTGQQNTNDMDDVLSFQKA